VSSVSAVRVALSRRTREYGDAALVAYTSIIIVMNETSTSCFSGGGTRGGDDQARPRAPPESG
jgi:hypothetical protein